MPLYGVVNAHLLLATVLIGAGIGLISGAFGKGGCVLFGAGLCAASSTAGLEIALGGALAELE